MVISLDAEFFWRDAYKNEVDVVKIIDNKILPIEIKYSQTGTTKIKLFMKKFKSDEGIILTYDNETEIDFDGKKLKAIPFYRYFLSSYRFHPGTDF